ARAMAQAALRVAKEPYPSAGARVVRGFPAHTLIDEIERCRAGLVVVGSHGQGRIAGILLGSTATNLVHNAPCSVLVTRQLRNNVPRRIAVGIDGSPESAAAYAAAHYLADRFDADLTVVVAEGDKPVDLAAVSLITGDEYHVIQEDPVSVLAA